MEPKDRKYTRKGEPDGPKLSPGERAINWAKAIAIIIPLLGIGAAANTTTVKRWVGLSEVNGTSPVVSEDIHPEVRAKIESLIVEIKAIKGQINQTRTFARRDDSGLKKEISELRETVNRWHGE